jgi:Zn-dependent M16 (insulinase) family peptidase
MNAYQLIQQDQLQEFKSGGSLYRHTKSGAQIYHMANQDNENSFAFSFHTPPPDDSGVPHILEHTVLCGSESFPIKDPFITLYKGSMHTFLNAFTAPEFTVYPASTVVEKDFFNLMRIYGDAVFFPLLRREAFMQEGHHVGLDEQGKAQRVGIVYNEMKGSYSSHESLLVEHSFRALFPGDPLSRDSGGDPGYIPDLTYEQFVDFHKKHYHPSNCRIFLYGDIPVQKSLDFLDKHFLSRFESAEPPLPNREIIPWNKPEIMEFPAPKGESDGCSHSVNWLLSPAWQPEERVALQVLAQILMGHGGSPLQMAIQQSPLGEDLSPVSGLELDVGHILFTLGIRGSARENAQAFKELVFNELQKLCDHGISDEQINGALGLVEFREREIRGGTPLGLRLMGRLSRSWGSVLKNPLLGLKNKLRIRPSGLL